MPDLLYFVLALVLILPGLIGIFLPVLPGIPYMFIVTLVYSILTHFHRISSSELIALGVIAVLSLLVDHLSGLLGARLGGASKQSLLLGLACMIIGTFIFPIVGSFAGLFLGIFAAEYMFGRKPERIALKAAASGVLGSLAGVVINLVLAIIYVVLFVVFGAKG